MLQSLVDTKKDVSEIIQDALSVPISERIYRVYLDTQKQGLKKFQQELQEIAKWNNYIISQETKEITANVSYDISHLLNIYIKTCLKIKFFEYHKKINHMDITIPSLEDFIHRCLVNIADFAWKHAYLFSQSLKSVEIQNNMNIIEFNIKKIIHKTTNEYVNGKSTIEHLNRLLNKSVAHSKKSRKNIKDKEIVRVKENKQDTYKTDSIKKTEYKETVENVDDSDFDRDNVEDTDSREEVCRKVDEVDEVDECEQEDDKEEQNKVDDEIIDTYSNELLSSKNDDKNELVTSESSSDDIELYDDYEKSQEETHTVNFQSDQSSSEPDSELESLSSECSDDDKKDTDDLNIKIVKIDNEINEKKKQLSFFTKKNIY